MHSSLKDEIKDVNFNFVISFSLQYPHLLIFAAMPKKKKKNCSSCCSYQEYTVGVSLNLVSACVLDFKRT